MLKIFVISASWDHDNMRNVALTLDEAKEKLIWMIHAVTGRKREITFVERMGYIYGYEEGRQATAGWIEQFEIKRENPLHALALKILADDPVALDAAKDILKS